MAFHHFMVFHNAIASKSHFKNRTKDTTLTNRYDIPYDDPKSRISYGLDYLINDNFNIGIAAGKRECNNI